MPKDGHLTLPSGLHGRLSSKTHSDHQNQNKAWALRKVFHTAHCERKDQPVFRSDVSSLSKGRNWLLENGRWKLVAGDKWDKGMAEIEKEYSWHHQRQRRTSRSGIKIYYTRRKINDRQTLSATDVHGRPKTDVLRKTIDLRPDHSRALEYLLLAGRRDDLFPVIDEIRLEQVRLFESIYRRSAICLGEHDDSGQFHNDIWNTGISEKSVADSNAVIKKVSGKEILVTTGIKRTIRHRQLFRQYGVGVGMASYDRHLRALNEAALPGKEVMGFTAEVLERNAGLAAGRKRARSADIGQIREQARDLRLYAEVDAFVAARLKALDPEIYSRASAEYVEFLKTGYKEKKLGLEDDTIEVTNLKRRIQELERSAEIKRENSDGIRATIRAILEMLMEVPGVKTILENAAELWTRIVELAGKVGLNLTNSPVIEPVETEGRKIIDKCMKGMSAEEIATTGPHPFDPDIKDGTIAVAGLVDAAGGLKEIGEVAKAKVKVVEGPVAKLWFGELEFPKNPAGEKLFAEESVTEGPVKTLFDEFIAVKPNATEQAIAEEFFAGESAPTVSTTLPKPNALEPINNQKGHQGADPTKPKPRRNAKISEQEKNGPTI
jgi:hypothetical protein